MPIYDYKCKCGKEFDKLLTIDKRNDEVKCECGKKANRNISTPTLIGFDKNGSSNKGQY